MPTLDAIFEEIVPD